MEIIEELVDERQKSWCIHCGRGILARETNRDHAPSKCLLRKPHPENLPEVLVHRKCNSGFSLDEEYLATFLSCVISGSEKPDAQINPKAAGTLKRSPKLQKRIGSSKIEYKTYGGDERKIWKPELKRVNRVLLKNARGHAFHEYGEPLLDQPASIWAVPLALLEAEQRARFEEIPDSGAWPEVGSRMMTRVLTGEDMIDGWVIVQEGIYRYAVTQAGGMLVRSVLHEYLATEVYWE